MTNFVFIAILLVCTLGSVVTVHISPKLDFDSDEQSFESNYSNPLNVPTFPRGIKNIYVVVNKEGITISGPGTIDCKENVCQMFVTDVDSIGNIISAVQVTVVSKMPRFKVDDIPIIDGVRGTNYNAQGSTRSRYFVYKIPQFSNIYRQQTIAQKKQPPATLTRSFEHWSPRIANPSPVDDKIEAPLSETNFEDEGPI